MFIFMNVFAIKMTNKYYCNVGLLPQKKKGKKKKKTYPIAEHKTT
jgi:hypothetical protein